MGKQPSQRNLNRNKWTEPYSNDHTGGREWGTSPGNFVNMAIGQYTFKLRTKNNSKQISYSS